MLITESLRTDGPTSEFCIEQEHSMSRAQTSLVQIFYLAFLFREKSYHLFPNTSKNKKLTTNSP